MNKSIQKGTKYLLALSMVALFSACGTDDNTGENSVEDGSAQYVAAEVIDDINASTMLQVIKGNFDADATNAFAYKAVKITYNTIGQNDEPIVASGLLVIPSASIAYQAYLASLGKVFSVSIINENHGTIFTEGEAPTGTELTNGLPDYLTSIIMTGIGGFASVVPDYIGYGESGDIAHPYMLKKSAVRSSVDMIKASMKYMQDTGVVLNHQLYVSGYSQGGYNAMAVAEYLEKDGTIENLNFMGVAAMAGPHSIADLGDQVIDANEIMKYPAFLGYLADSYAYYYDDMNLDDIVVETNTTLYHSLFDGSKTGLEIHAGLGLTTNNGFAAYKANALFQDTFINEYQTNLNNATRTRFVENKSYTNSWTPQTKVNLIHCIDDEIIPFWMSQNAFNELNATGADVTLSPIPSSYIPVATATTPFVHSRCGGAAYSSAVKWFAAIRVGEI